MKRKDMTLLVVAVAILLVAGYIVYTQLMPKKSTSSNTLKVEKVGVIESTFDADALEKVTDSNLARDYTVPVDAIGGGNDALFGR